MASTARLTDRALIDVTGPEARPFLNNLLTQDVETIGVGALRYGALLTPQGRLLYDVFLLGTDQGVRLDVAADWREPLIARLSQYRLRAKVVIVAADAPVHALWDVDAAAAPWLADPRTPALGFRVYGEVAAAGEPGDYAAHRLALGVTDPFADGLHDRAYPLEADLDLLNAIDFRKGCFVGQETTSRMKRRGTIKTRLLPLVFDGPAPPFGSEVLAGTLRAGETLSATDGRALALLRLDRLASPLTVDGRTVRVDPPPWFPPLGA